MVLMCITTPGSGSAIPHESVTTGCLLKVCHRTRCQGKRKHKSVCTHDWSNLIQVLPREMVVLAEPNPDSLLAALEEAVQHVHAVDPMQQHQQVLAHSTSHQIWHWIASLVNQHTADRLV